MIAYSLGNSRKAESPIFCSAVAIGTIFTLMPLVNAVVPNGSEKAVEVSGILPFSLLGTGGIFVAIFASMLSTELFVWLSKNEKLKIKLTGTVPPAVAQSFNALIAIIITLLAAGFVSFGIHQLIDLEVHALINKMIQAPMIGLTTSLPGFIVLCFFTNLLFSLGIHPSGIVNPILEPPLLTAMAENSDAFKNHLDIPHIIVLPFRDLYGHIGGTGSTIALVVAIFLVSRKKFNRAFAKMSGPLGLFNINEPIIYGFPVVFNPLIMIPFIFGPLICFVIAYFATAAGLVSRIAVYVPWSMPPLMNGFVASGGDFRNVILQLILITLMVMIYIPFLRAHELSMDAEVVGAKSKSKSKSATAAIADDDFSDFSDFQEASEQEQKQ
jgi:PTS system cellobiose-specific IIC component